MGIGFGSFKAHTVRCDCIVIRMFMMPRIEMPDCLVGRLLLYIESNRIIYSMILKTPDRQFALAVF